MDEWKLKAKAMISKWSDTAFPHINRTQKHMRRALVAAGGDASQFDLCSAELSCEIEESSAAVSGSVTSRSHP